ncbi:unnamed protein product [Plutella xylostella]|uniref:(diamondback moth) hypothetical protein n=1 Tax=Plutella xylostella TaxID=51655 RepID=A0A8S4G5U4_PLUXY|nr:unnamed protein product [Plutella xylostella]
MGRTIKMLQKKMRYLLTQQKSYKKRLSVAKEVIKSTSFDSLTKKMTKTAKTFVEMQMTQASKQMRGRRFTLEQKILALSVYKSSPKAYRVLSQICILPKRKTLQCLLQKITLTPGINKKMFDHLSKRVKKMPDNHKYCAIIFDEMAISPHLDLAEGKIVGFVDDGEKREPVIADHVLVFMVRGVIKKFKQPVHYSFCAGTTKTQNIKNMLKKVIEEVQACGLEVVATVCDQGATNMAAINALKTEARAKNLRAEKEQINDSCFEIGGKTIVPLYDPPHLIKGVRNNFLTKDLVYTMDNKKCVAKWQHIIDLYLRSPGYRGVRLIPKLTEHHVMPQLIPKMRVKYSTQVFSHTVGVALGFMAESGKLPLCAKETADILILFDDLFDSVNGSYSKVQSGKIYRSAVTPKSRHHQLWRDSIPVLKSMKYINKDGKTAVVPSLSSWVKTIEGFQLLCRHMFQLGQTSLLLRHFNQDPIENFFGAIRAHGLSNIMPTAAAFQAAYKTLMVNNMSSAHSVGANCERDKNKCLQNLKNMIEEEKEEKQKEHELTMEDLNIRRNDILTSNSPQDVERRAAVGYCSGWLHRSSRRYQVDVEVDRLMAIEEKQGVAELLTAWANALKPKGDLAAAARDGVNILIEIAQQLSRNTKLRASRPITIVTSYGSRCCCAVVDDVMIYCDDVMPELSSRSGHPAPTSQRRSSRRNQVDVEVDRVMAIEEKQVEA